MNSANNNKKSNGQVMYYDVATGESRKGNLRKLTSKYSSKETVNLCIHEKKGISYELFFLLLAAMLLVLMLIEFFGAYRPYLILESAENRLAEDRAEVRQINDDMADYEKVESDYLAKNYKNFPRERVNRDDVFQLIEEVVFPRGIITRFTLTENILELQISNVTLENLNIIPAEIEDSEIVENYEMPLAEIKYDNEDKIASFRIIIRFKNAA